MTDHYFSETPDSAHDRREIRFQTGGREFVCTTDAGTFSRGHLDPGTALLLSCLPEDAPARALDVGCGWGAITLSLAAGYPQAQVVGCDINQRALDLCRENLTRNHLRAECVHSDGLAEVAGPFDLILTNPPIRAGKAALHRIYEGCRDALSPGGRLLLVIRKQQGAPSTQTYLSGLFRTVRRIARDKGYWVLQCEEPICDKTEGAPT